MPFIEEFGAKTYVTKINRKQCANILRLQKHFSKEPQRPQKQFADMADNNVDEDDKADNNNIDDDLIDKNLS